MASNISIWQASAEGSTGCGVVGMVGFLVGSSVGSVSGVGPGGEGVVVGLGGLVSGFGPSKRKEYGIEIKSVCTVEMH